MVGNMVAIVPLWVAPQVCPCRCNYGLLSLS
jgi:hypothetical protein